MTFHIFKATRHLDDDGYGEGSVLKIDSNDVVARGKHQLDA